MQGQIKYFKIFIRYVINLSGESLYMISRVSRIVGYKPMLGDILIFEFTSIQFKNSRFFSVYWRPTNLLS